MKSKVFSNRRVTFFIFLMIELFSSKISYSTLYTSIADGVWSNSAIWSPIGVPTSGDAVVINNTITMDANVSIDSLVMNGILNAGTWMISVTNPSTASVQRLSGYVKGKIFRAMDNLITYFFPVGDSGRYRPVSITTSGGGSFAYSVEFRRQDPNASVIPCPCNTSMYDATLSDIYEYYYWVVEKFLGGNDIAITFTYDDSDPGINDADVQSGVLQLARWNGSNWINMGGNAQDTVNNNLTSNTTGHGTFGAYSFARSSGEFIMPIVLSSFSARIKEDGINLNWITSSEINNQGFSVERSLDGHNFESIGFVAGGGTSAGSNYEFVDREKNGGTNYYRLKQVDYDGMYAYSYIIEVAVSQCEDCDFRVSQNYSNPAYGKTKIDVYLPEDGTVSVMLHNIIGQDVKGFGIYLKQGSHTLDMDVSDLTTGTYFYTVSFSGQSVSSKMLVMNTK